MIDLKSRLISCGLTGAAAITVHEREDADIGQQYFVEERYLTAYFEYKNMIEFRKREKEMGHLESLAMSWKLGGDAFRHGSKSLKAHVVRVRSLYHVGAHDDDDYSSSNHV